jgi:sortase A
VRELGLALITAGVIVLAFVVYQLYGTALTEQKNQTRLHANFEAAPAAPLARSAADSGPSAPAGTAIDHLVIPKIGVDKYVVEGVQEDDLVNGPGHYPGTVLPGQDGNAAIAGHRTTYGAPFFNLDQLRAGDLIEITARGGEQFRYQVTASKVVSPDDVAVLDPTTTPELTLTTCNPRYSATSRLIVTAALVGQPVSVSTATANVAPAASGSLGGGNHKAWPPTIVYGAVVVLAWVATRLLINRTRRWRRLGAYVGGIAVCCVPLWFCFENVVRLLPQSI